MSRRTKKRKRDKTRAEFNARIATAARDAVAEAEKPDYTKKSGSVIKGQLARGQAGKFVNATDLIKAGKPLDVDVGLNPEQLQGMLALSQGKQYDDGDVLDQLFDAGMIGDDGKLNSRARAIMTALKKNDQALAKKLADKYVKKPKEPKAKAAKKAAPKPKTKTVVKQKVDANAQASLLADTAGVDVKQLNNILKVAGGGALDSGAAKALAAMGAIEIVDGKPTLTAAGKTLVKSLQAGDQKAAASALKGLTKAAKPKEADAMPYTLKGKCVYKKSGELVKCHPTEEKARAHYEALQANVPDAAENDDAYFEYEISMGEAAKIVSGVSHPMGDFLVHTDPEKPGTWSLPVKKNGTPDRKLAGAAWAALFDPGGHRGNKYAGPDKSKAQKALRALYKAEEWPMPGESTKEVEMGEYYETPMPYVSLGIRSFADLRAARNARQAVDTIREYASLFPVMVDNILQDSEEGDKKAAIRTLAGEFADEVGSALTSMNGNGSSESYSEDAADVDMTGEIGEAVALFDVKDIAESDAERYAKVLEDGKKTYAYLDIVAIKPGWGNKRDNHYYPREVVASESSIEKFVGAKMYESEHDRATRDNSTWVSTIVEAVGLHSSGAPIYRTAIHDPYFTEKVRNLEEMGLLHKLECSIMGDGKALPNFTEGGRHGKRLTEFTTIHNVDWVTKAGAGGHALALVNTNESGGIMKDDKKQQTPVASAEAEANAPQTVSVHEQNGDGTPQAAQPAQAAQPQAAPQPAPAAAPAPQQEAPKAVEAAEVAKLLEASSLPEVSRKRLAEASYQTPEAVEKAIKSEVEYLKEITGSGRPVGMLNYFQPQQDEALKEVNEAKDKVNARFMGT